MSTKNFERSFTKPLLKKLDTEARKSVSRQQGQLLILADTNELKKVVQVSTGTTPSKTDLALALSEAQKHARKLQAAFASGKGTKRRYNAVVSKLPEIRLPYTLNVDMFIVSSFSRSISVIKDTMIDSLLKSGALKDSDRASVSKNLHKGHGSKGNAVSQVQIAASVASLDTATKKLLLHNLTGSFVKGDLGNFAAFREIRRLVTKGHNIVTKKGKLNANYVSVIAFQTSSDNIEDSKEEKAVKAVFRKFIGNLTEDMLDMEGSPSLKSKTAALVTDKFKGKKNVKVKAKSVKMNTRTKAEGKGAKAGRKIALSAKVAPKRRRKVKDSGIINPIQMIALLNKQLPETVRKNMQSPELVNRTGRFAESVRVTDVIKTPKGFPSVGYTYQANPYQIFEDGRGSAPWANGERDPRSLIDGSIREIAAKLAIGRFYTRRV